ncbi:hypothetical protein ACTFIW_009281 [Dictyostelium discoideum]
MIKIDKNSYEPLYDIEIPDGSPAKLVSDLVESFEKYKSTAMLYASLKPKEDGTYPTFKFSDIMCYYSGDDRLLENKTIQDLFFINILDLNFPGVPKRKKAPKNKK